MLYLLYLSWIMLNFSENEILSYAVHYQNFVNILRNYFKPAYQVLVTKWTCKFLLHFNCQLSTRRMKYHVELDLLYDLTLTFHDLERLTLALVAILFNAYFLHQSKCLLE